MTTAILLGILCVGLAGVLWGAIALRRSVNRIDNTIRQSHDFALWEREMETQP